MTTASPTTTGSRRSQLPSKATPSSRSSADGSCRSGRRRRGGTRSRPASAPSRGRRAGRDAVGRRQREQLRTPPQLVRPDRRLRRASRPGAPAARRSGHGPLPSPAPRGRTVPATTRASSSCTSGRLGRGDWPDEQDYGYGTGSSGCDLALERRPLRAGGARRLDPDADRAARPLPREGTMGRRPRGVDRPPRDRAGSGRRRCERLGGRTRLDDDSRPDRERLHRLPQRGGQARSVPRVRSLGGRDRRPRPGERRRFGRARPPTRCPGDHARAGARRRGRPERRRRRRHRRLDPRARPRRARLARAAGRAPPPAAPNGHRRRRDPVHELRPRLSRAPPRAPLRPEAALLPP